MYCATTNGIKVSVQPEYSEDRSDPAASRYFWLYTIDIANEGANAAQLTERYWLIVDANGHRQEVRGPGVVGEQPMLKPGEIVSLYVGLSALHPERHHVRILQDGRRERPRV